jgi:hypothetical protein
MAVWLRDGEVLLRMGTVNAEELRSARAHQQSWKGTLPQALLALGLVTEEALREPRRSTPDRTPIRWKGRYVGAIVGDHVEDVRPRSLILRGRWMPALYSASLPAFLDTLEETDRTSLDVADVIPSSSRWTPPPGLHLSVQFTLDRDAGEAQLMLEAFSLSPST